MSAALVAFVAAYIALLPGAAFWDTGELQAVGPLLGTAHPTGFPTYVILGWLASIVLQPLGDPAFRMNLLSAVFLGIAAGITVDLVRALTGSAAVALVAGIGLALTPIAWDIGTHADVHALHLVFVALLLRLLVAWEDAIAFERPSADRLLIACAAVFGLAMGNHSLTLLLAVPVALFVFAVQPGILRRRGLVIRCVLALVAMLVLVYLELPIRAGLIRAPLVYATPSTLSGFIYVVLGQQFTGSIIDPFGDLAGKSRDLVDLTVAQFGILSFLIPIGFVGTLLTRPRYALLTGSAVVITCFFAASYQNADIGRYYLGPILIAWTWLAVLGSMIVESVFDRDLRSMAAPVASAALAGLLFFPTALAIPDRLAVVQDHRITDARGWLDDVLTRLEPNAVIVSWWSYSTPLWYATLVEGRRPDITLIDDRTRLDQDLGSVPDVIDRYLSTRPVYVMRQHQSETVELGSIYEFSQFTGSSAGRMVKVVRKLDGS